MKISVVLEALTGRFDTDMDRSAKRAEKNFKQLEKDAVAFGKAVGAALAVGATAFAGIVKSAVNAADDMYRLSQTTGLATEALSQLDYAAKMAGVDDLTGSLAKFNKTIGEAAQGGKGQTAAFKALGVSIRDEEGNLRSTEDLLLDVADAFSQYEDGAEKVTLAQDLFGKSGAGLIPLLNEGKKGISELRAEAEALGLTIRGDTAAAADEFNDNLDRIGAMVRGVATRTAAELLPTLAKLSETFITNLKDTEAVDKAMRGLAASFKLVVTTGLVLKNVADLVGKTLGGIAAYVVALFKDGFKAADEVSRAWYSDVKGDVSDVLEGIDNIWKEGMAALPAPAEDANDKIRKSFKLTADSTEKDAKRAAEAVKELNRLIAQEEADRAEGQAVRDSVRTPDERRDADILKLNDQYTRQIIDAETRTRRLVQINDEYYRSLEALDPKLEETSEQISVFADQSARNAQDAFADFLFDPFKDGLDGMVKQFSDAMRRIAANQLSQQLITMGVNALGSAFGFTPPSVGGKSAPVAAPSIVPGKSSQTGGGAQNIRIYNQLDTDTMAGVISSEPGEMNVMNVIRRNGSVIRQIAAGMPA